MRTNVVKERRLETRAREEMRGYWVKRGAANNKKGNIPTTFRRRNPFTRHEVDIASGVLDYPKGSGGLSADPLSEFRLINEYQLKTPKTYGLDGIYDRNTTERLCRME
ncbi:hypothetical protein JTE90_002174 [Oedothorax gibbosus]|uniref:Uncharacterized protein n=1 Tax=Oedothorax gibbosus TaxID=931172 RepID=A0AAV6VHK8_9ARAC|nr:hypothetical protein JTE90_002174 [Oedothorax gibbosus]